jgi:hypothetical protein
MWNIEGRMAEGGMMADGGEIKLSYYKIKNEDEEGVPYYSYVRQHIASPTPFNSEEITKEEYDAAKGGYMAKGGVTKESIKRTLTSDTNQYFLEKDNDGYILYISPKGAMNSTFHYKFNVEDLGTDGTRMKYKLTKLEKGGYMAEGGEIMKHKHNEHITIELIEPTNKGWKVKQIETHSVGGRKLSTPKEKVAYFSKEELSDLFEPTMAKGGYMAKGGEITREDITILGVPRSKITDKEWESIIRMSKYQKGATFILKDEKGLDVKPQIEYDWYVNEKMADGGKVKFADKVKSVQESLLKRKKVSPKVQKDYGKTYSKAEAKESAQRIVGSRMAQLKEKMAKKKK